MESPAPVVRSTACTSPLPPTPHPPAHTHTLGQQAVRPVLPTTLICPPQGDQAPHAGTVLFPHVFGPLSPPSCVIQQMPVLRDAEGNFLSIVREK
jgi:hypothetical protein